MNINDYNNADLVFINGDLDGHHLRILVDNGCTGIILNSRYKSLLYDLGRSETCLKFANGTLTGRCPIGKMNIKMTNSFNKTINKWITAYVADIDYDMILGMSWMNRKPCVINTGTSTCKFEGVGTPAKMKERGIWTAVWTKLFLERRQKELKISVNGVRCISIKQMNQQLQI